MRPSQPHRIHVRYGACQLVQSACVCNMQAHDLHAAAEGLHRLPLPSVRHVLCMPCPSKGGALQRLELLATSTHLQGEEVCEVWPHVGCREGCRKQVKRPKFVAGKGKPECRPSGREGQGLWQPPDLLQTTPYTQFCTRYAHQR